MYHITVTKANIHERIDKFLAHHLQVSRHKIQQAIDAHLICVNDGWVKSSYTLRNQDVIRAQLPLSIDTEACVGEAIPLDIRYEDAHLLVIYKPARMVVHPDTTHRTGTLVHALLHCYTHLPLKDNMPTRPGLVHRLDKDTSGLLVVAKTAESLASLERQFYEHRVVRTYYALVWGSPKEDSASIDVPIGKSSHKHQIISAFPDHKEGKRAVTHYRVIERFCYVTLVACQLETGRTHQIRVHMKHIGHPIFGDLLYGGHLIASGQRYASYKAFVGNCFKLMPYQALHAATLGFKHPITQSFMLFEAPLPENFIKLIEKWKKYVAAHYVQAS